MFLRVSEFQPRLYYSTDIFPSVFCSWPQLVSLHISESQDKIFERNSDLDSLAINPGFFVTANRFTAGSGRKAYLSSVYFSFESLPVIKMTDLGVYLVSVKYQYGIMIADLPHTDSLGFYHLRGIGTESRRTCALHSTILLQGSRCHGAQDGCFVSEPSVDLMVTSMQRSLSGRKPILTASVYLGAFFDDKEPHHAEQTQDDGDIFWAIKYQSLSCRGRVTTARSSRSSNS
ncbi:hypothetical protein QBC37DRAFT_479051 [Rhypophila decipiens]|uniref:Uncharacterized protein n=1 Tax=Rhypophila decipiens TaxID=261697 RepID=A0AAN6YLA0_9PEZI|nr:hypothetical protein QBC37DRAFT_479051 [Rhypophila decipiens]